MTILMSSKSNPQEVENEQQLIINEVHTTIIIIILGFLQQMAKQFTKKIIFKISGWIQ